MYISAGKIPYEPGINGAADQLSVFCSFSGAIDMVKDPLYFCCREVGVKDESSFFLNQFMFACFAEFVTVVCGTFILPYNGIVDWSTTFFFPYNDSFTLVGYSDSCNIFAIQSGFCCCFRCHSRLGGPNFMRIMFHPAGFREYLCEFFLSN